MVEKKCKIKLRFELSLKRSYFFRIFLSQKSNHYSTEYGTNESKVFVRFSLNFSSKKSVSTLKENNNML